MDMIYRKERLLFGIAIVLSALFWLILVTVTKGLALIYVVMFFIVISSPNPRLSPISGARRSRSRRSSFRICNSG